MNKLLLAAAAALAIPAAASAHTITFDGLPLGDGVTGYSYVDGAYNVSLGGLWYDAAGEIEPVCCDNSGVLTVTKVGGGLFSFGSIDHQVEYYQQAGFTVKGYLGASLIFSQSGLSTSYDYSTYLSNNASAIDKLEVTGVRDYSGGVSLDNLVVDNAGAVPEPASWAMMIGGFAIAGAAMRRRQASVSFA